MRVVTANAAFFLTGIAFVPIYQQASYWGFNEPGSLLAPYSFFFFMFLGGTIHVLLKRLLRRSETQSASAAGNEQRYTKRQQMLALMIAGFTVTDNVASIVGISYIGSMLYSIIFGWIVVATAVIRRFLLMKSLGFWQWIGVICVSLGLTLAGLEGEEEPTSQPATHFLIGLLATLFAATCDAVMYVGAEEVLSNSVGIAGVTVAISEAELSLIVGVVGCTVLAPIGWVYGVTGYWKEVLYDPLKEHVGTECTQRLGVGAGEEPGIGMIVTFWICGGVCMYVHYLAFYALVHGCNNSVVAGVAKSVQSVAVFFVNAALFGQCDERQHVTALKACSAAAVISGSAMYSLCKSKPSIAMSSGNVALLEHTSKKRWLQVAGGA